LREIEYERQLDTDARLRVQHRLSHGRVVEFVIQLEVYAKERWTPTVRYDTAHRFAHRDFYHPSGRVTKTDLKMSMEEALSFALQDLRDNWEAYRDRFLKR
jgi:hypothetical protein